MAGKEMKGTVKWFSAKRGYGFLVDADGIDYFVHYSEIQSEGFKTLRNNMEVSFMVEEDVLWSSIFVTLMANKIGGLQFGIYRNCQISSRVFHTAVTALPLTKANRSDFE